MSVTRLSKKQLDGMSVAADDVSDGIATLKGVFRREPQVDLDGWHTNTALITVSGLWASKVAVCEDDWQNYSLALDLTAAHVVETDYANAFHFPNTP